MTQSHIEQAGSLKLFFPEGEIDFVVSGYLTECPVSEERLFGRIVKVETSAEIIAKKVHHRGVEFTARDVYDLALVTEREPAALREIEPILSDRRDVILDRISSQEAALRETFAALELLEYRRSFDECVALVRKALR